MNRLEDITSALLAAGSFILVIGLLVFGFGGCHL
jgi:hypothetical protein